MPGRWLIYVRYVHVLNLRSERRRSFALALIDGLAATYGYTDTVPLCTPLKQLGPLAVYTKRAGCSWRGPAGVRPGPDCGTDAAAYTAPALGLAEEHCSTAARRST